MSYFEWLFYIIGMLALILLPLSMLVLRLTLDRRVRKQLPKDKEYDAYPDWYFGFGRAIIFGCASVWDRANNSWQMQLFYEGFDVKSFANPFEKFVAYCSFFGVTVLVGGGSIYTVLEALGFVSWFE